MPKDPDLAPDLRLILAASAPQAVLAAGAVAPLLGLAAAAVASRLAEAPGELARLPCGPARRAAALLACFGLRVRLEPAIGPARPADPPRFDLALQPRRSGSAEDCVRPLALALGLCAEAVRCGLAGPEGLVLRGLDWPQVAEWRRRFAGLAPLRLTVSDPAGATFDLLPQGRPGDPAQALALPRHLRRLGIGPCPVTGAVGAGLDQTLRDHVLARFPRAGVIAVNRDFQRFDLVLADPPACLPEEIARFLAIRGRPVIAESAGDTQPMRLECALPRADALAFQADYAAIGLPTRLQPVAP
jgi:hypothetical protein